MTRVALGIDVRVRAFLGEVEAAARETAQHEFKDLEEFVRVRKPAALPLTLSDARFWEEQFRRERFDFDSVLLPYSYIMMQDPYYAASFEKVSEVCAERNVAMLTIKSIARRPWWGRERTMATWYEPFQEQSDIDLAVHWVLGRPGIFVASPGDIHLMPKALDAASRFESAPDEETMREHQSVVQSFRS